jgi:hypothetical protein
MSRVDSPRMNPAITGASRALVLVTPVPNSWQANRSVVPRSFGRCTVTGPAVILIVVGQCPLRIPDRACSQAAARWERSRPRKAATSPSIAACNSS